MKRWLSRRQRALIECAPISDAPPSDRAMHSALESARTIPEAAASLTAQQQFDQALAGLVRRIQIPAKAAEWFVNANLIRREKRSWIKTARHPAILATALAVLVMTGIGVFFFVEHLREFPGSETAKRLLVFAGATRRYQFEPLNTDAINLGDYFFMKSQLEHYDVPMQFADFRARAVRVFDDEDGHRFAQVVLAEKGVQFFLYPADKAAGHVTPKPGDRPTWGYVEAENWAGAVLEREGVCFMIAMHGTEEELRTYLGDRGR
ncbi:MAG: hypothetical protein ACR2II_09695 [Chthoniobacterales bacterium]